MKRNAIIRIIIWSCVIVLLVGIMGTVVAAKSVSSHWAYAQELTLNVTSPKETTIVDPPTDRGTPFETSGIVTKQVNVRTYPSLDAPVSATLEPGDTIQITNYEQANGLKWVFITSPASGWVMGEYVDLNTKTADTPSTSSAAEAYDHSTPAEGLREIEIEWVAGSITIEPADVGHVTVKETKASDPKYTMICKTSGDKLFIRFCDEDVLARGFGLSFGEDFSKNLIIRVPRDFQLDSLEVEAASATMSVKNMVIRSVEFDGASGTCDFENCVVDKLDLDTASGDVTFSGTLKNLDCDAASANVRAVLDNVPSRIEMDSMSGDLDLTLPAWAGFTVSMDAMSSDFITDFDTTTKNNHYICGDGSCRISMDAMSGDVYIHKLVSAGASPLVEETQIPEATAAETIVP